MATSSFDKRFILSSDPEKQAFFEKQLDIQLAMPKVEYDLSICSPQALEESYRLIIDHLKSKKNN